MSAVTHRPSSFFSLMLRRRHCSRGWLWRVPNTSSPSPCFKILAPLPSVRIPTSAHPALEKPLPGIHRRHNPGSSHPALRIYAPPLDPETLAKQHAFVRGFSALGYLELWSCLDESAFLSLSRGDIGWPKLKTPEHMPQLQLLAISEGSSWPALQSIVSDRKKAMYPITCVNFYAMEGADYEQWEQMAEWLKG
jgi:hypothetical protein